MSDSKLDQAENAAQLKQSAKLQQQAVSRQIASEKLEAEAIQREMQIERQYILHPNDRLNDKRRLELETAIRKLDSRYDSDPFASRYRDFIIENHDPARAMLGKEISELRSTIASQSQSLTEKATDLKKKEAEIGLLKTNIQTLAEKESLAHLLTRVNPHGLLPIPDPAN